MFTSGTRDNRYLSGANDGTYSVPLIGISRSRSPGFSRLLVHFAVGGGASHPMGFSSYLGGPPAERRLATLAKRFGPNVVDLRCPRRPSGNCRGLDFRDVLVSRHNAMPRQLSTWTLTRILTTATKYLKIKRFEGSNSSPDRPDQRSQVLHTGQCPAGQVLRSRDDLRRHAHAFMPTLGVTVTLLSAIGPTLISSPNPSLVGQP